MKLHFRFSKFIVLFLICTMISSIVLPNVQVKAVVNTPYGDLLEGEEVIFLDGFDDLTLYDAVDPSKQAVTTPWIQEGGSSLAKISATSSHTAPNRVKLDSTDSMSVQLNATGYENIKVYYTSSKGTYTSGSVIVEYSADGGTTWTNIEEFTGTDLDINSSKIKSLGIVANNIGNLKLRFKVGTAISGNLYVDTVMVTGTPVVTETPTPTTEPTPTAEPTATPTASPYPVVGDELQLFTDNFDDPDAYGTTGNVAIPPPWIQENSSSVAKTSASGNHTLPNRVKIDAADSLALPLDTRAYGNIKINYTSGKGTYVGGSVVVEYSIDGGTTWKLIEEFRGTDSDINSSKTKILGVDASNNEKLKVRFRVGEPLTGSNLYIDSFSVTGQLIEGMTPVGPVVKEPEPVPVKPFTPPAGVKFYQDVEIGMAGANKLYTSIAVPEVPTANPMPVIVYIHGGGWNHGSRTEHFSKISAYVSKGYIGVALDYRLTPEAPAPAQIQDVKLAIRYLRANAALYNIDPDRIGVWGSSAGGHLASLLGTTADILPSEQVTLDNGNTVNVPDMEGNGGWAEYSDRVQAVVDFSGPADFTTEFANIYSSVTKLLGANAFSVPDLARLAMPGTYASSDDPPFFIRHGDADVTIPYTDSVKLYNQLVAANVPIIDYKIVAGQGHGFTGEASTTANAEAWAFLDQYVKNRVVTEHVMYKPGYSPNIPVNFDDLDNFSWAEEQIEVLASKGIIKGTGNNKFSPDNNIIRGDFLLLLVKTLGLTATVDSNFSDVNTNDYYYEAVGIAKKLGLAMGTGNNNFEPTKEISRQDMMVLVARAMNIAGKLQSTGTISNLEAFEDKYLIADYASIDIATLVKEGIVIGNGSNIEPRKYTTRAEAAVLLYRIYIK